MVLKTARVRRPGASRGARSRRTSAGTERRRACASLPCGCEFFKIKRGGYMFVVKQNRQHRKMQESKNRLESLCLEMTTVDRLRTSFQVLVLSLSLHLLSVCPSVEWVFGFVLLCFRPSFFFPEDFGDRSQPVGPRGCPAFQICPTAPWRRCRTCSPLPRMAPGLALRSRRWSGRVLRSRFCFGGGR